MIKIPHGEEFDYWLRYCVRRRSDNDGLKRSFNLHLDLLYIQIYKKLVFFLNAINSLNHTSNALSIEYSHLQGICSVRYPKSFLRVVKGCLKRISHYFI